MTTIVTSNIRAWPVFEPCTNGILQCDLSRLGSFIFDRFCCGVACRCGLFVCLTAFSTDQAPGRMQWKQTRGHYPENRVPSELLPIFKEIKFVSLKDLLWWIGENLQPDRQLNTRESTLCCGLNLCRVCRHLGCSLPPLGLGFPRCMWKWLDEGPVQLWTPWC